MAGVGGIARNLFGLIVNRVELAALELSAVRTNLLKLLLVAALGIFTALFAIAFWSVLVVYLSWDALGWKILLIMTGVFALLALGLVLYARAMLRQGKLSLPATMAELKADRDMLM